LYIGQTRDPVFGGAALFVLAMGMGLPLLAFGAAAGRGMPTSGPWMTAAQAAGKSLLFDFYADWCVSCKEMDKYTFAEPAVQAALADFVLLKADVTANDPVDQALMQRYGIIGPPATLFFADGRERRELRLIGFEKAAPFAARVRRVGSAN
ncbi:MAG: thioredoxin family protein, partial [Gammaproteobacteria bacterium]|nr:thioredoxin family protein [Gammaproteobacteria bacterium]